MVDVKVKQRPVGATAVLGRTGFPHIESTTGGTLDIVTGFAQPGFSPLDLLYASLASCLVLSARVTASQMGVLDRVAELTAKVSGEKAEEGFSRVARFKIEFTIRGDLPEETRRAIVHAAEHEICTVSNTIRGNPEFDMELLS